MKVKYGGAIRPSASKNPRHAHRCPRCNRKFYCKEDKCRTWYRVTCNSCR